MSLALFAQFREALTRAKHPVIILHSAPTLDDFASAFCLVSLCKTLNKPCTIVTQGGRSPDTLRFLPNFQEVHGDLSDLNALTFKIDVTNAKVDELSYSVVNNELIISVTPKTGTWKLEDVKIQNNDYRYDLILIIGAKDRPSIGSLSTTYSDFFLKTPTIVIDHGPENEHFGTINIIDLTATSIAEVCFNLFNQIDPTMIDGPIATALLAGMISKTKSFRAPNVTPQTLEIAQKLMEKKADREKIVEHLYRTRSVETLRLWGRALARLKNDESTGLVWTLITKQDFTTAGAAEDSLRDIADELLLTSPSAKIAVLLFETLDGHIAGHLFAQRPFDALSLGAPFRATGSRAVARLSLPHSDLVSAERAVITHLQQTLKT